MPGEDPALPPEPTKEDRDLLAECGGYGGLPVSPCQHRRGFVEACKLFKLPEDLVKGGQQNPLARIAERNGLPDVVHVFGCQAEVQIFDQVGERSVRQLGPQKALDGLHIVTRDPLKILALARILGGESL